MNLAFLLIACVEPAPSVTDKPDDTGADTSADTDTGGDTSADTDTADTGADTGSDTGDTGAPALPGSISVSGTFGGVPYAFSCDQDDPAERFERSWMSSVGDVTASVSCADASSLTVSLLNPTVGPRTDPSEGANFFYQDASGTWLSWFDATPTTWWVQIDAVTWIDIETFQVDGSLAGVWEAGTVNATFSVQFPCGNC